MSASCNGSSALLSSSPTSSIYTLRDDDERAASPSSSECSSTCQDSAMDGIRRLRRRTKRVTTPSKPRKTRTSLQEMARPLRHWLYRNRKYPYPSKEQKRQLAEQCDMSVVQVSNWFSNARRRLKLTVGDSHKKSWSQTIKQYNIFVDGNAELLSNSSENSTCSDTDENEQDIDSINGEINEDKPDTGTATAMCVDEAAATATELTIQQTTATAPHPQQQHLAATHLPLQQQTLLQQPTRIQAAVIHQPQAIHQQPSIQPQQVIITSSLVTRQQVQQQQLQQQQAQQVIIPTPLLTRQQINAAGHTVLSPPTTPGATGPSGTTGRVHAYITQGAGGGMATSPGAGGGAAMSMSTSMVSPSSAIILSSTGTPSIHSRSSTPLGSVGSLSRRPHNSGGSSLSGSGLNPLLNLPGTDPSQQVVNKTPVMQRYLRDTCYYQLSSGVSGPMHPPGGPNSYLSRDRRRNPSGSLCSENMSMSSRSSPVHEMETDSSFGPMDGFVEDPKSEQQYQWNACVALQTMQKKKKS